MSETLSQSFHKTSGRRQREEATPQATTAHDDAPVEKSRTLADARAKFADSVSRGISVLMTECGYSRERAAATLLREISRGDTSPPGDEEIFQAMQELCLGIEEAARALTVSKALQRVQARRNVSILEAVDELTATLSVTNLIHRGSRSPTSAAVTCDELPHRTSTEIRIQPVPSLNAPRPTSAPASIDYFSSAATSNKKTKPVNNKNAKPKNTNGSRKRSAEELIESNRIDTSKKEAPIQTRPRADSLSEVVSAKFGEEEPRSTPLTSPAAVRVKRGLEGEAKHTALKRSRANSD